MTDEKPTTEQTLDRLDLEVAKLQDEVVLMRKALSPEALDLISAFEELDAKYWELLGRNNDLHFKHRSLTSSFETVNVRRDRWRSRYERAVEKLERVQHMCTYLSETLGATTIMATIGKLREMGEGK